jgi:hypothetical protein
MDTTMACKDPHTGCVHTDNRHKERLVANQPVIMGTVLVDTTARSPAPQFPPLVADPDPGCGLCPHLIAQTTAIYDPLSWRLSVQVPSVFATIEGVQVDVIVQVAANAEPRRYTAPPQGIDHLVKFHNDNWILPVDAPRAPTAMALVFTFGAHTPAVRVTIT